MSAATIDRRLAGQRAKLLPHGRSHTKPGSLLKSQIPIRTWAQWDNAVPGFVEIDLVGHEGGAASGQFCFTLHGHRYRYRVDGEPVRCRTRHRGTSSRPCRHVAGGRSRFPSSASIRTTAASSSTTICSSSACEHRITFTRSRPSNKNDGAHVEQKNWARVRELVGYLRYDTAAELELLNEIWELDRIFTNYLLPQQKLIAKVRHGAKVRKTHDRAATPHRRAVADPAVARMPVLRMNAEYKKIRPAALSRQILALTGRLEAIATAKQPAPIKPAVNERWNHTSRRFSHEATNQPSRRFDVRNPSCRYGGFSPDARSGMAGFGRTLARVWRVLGGRSLGCGGGPRGLGAIRERGFAVWGRYVSEGLPFGPHT